MDVIQQSNVDNIFRKIKRFLTKNITFIKAVPDSFSFIFVCDSAVKRVLYLSKNTSTKPYASIFRPYVNIESCGLNTIALNLFDS